jgi:Zn-dependent protease
MPFIDLLLSNQLMALAWVLAIIVAITVHEFSHALVATLQGDNTAQLEGRVSLNPLSHVDPVGFIALILVGFGWGKPVPFNPYNLKAKRWGPALVSLAGPGSNLAGAIVFGIVLRLVLQFGHISSDSLLISFLTLLVHFNIVLMLFNLIPVPPLDGSKLLTLLPRRFDNLVETLNRYGFVILIFIIIAGQPVLARVFGAVTDFVFKLIGA